MKVPILLPNIFNHPFTYESDLKLKVGDYVVVPFGKSKITGVVWDEFEKKNNRNFKIKNVLKKLDVVPLKKTTIKFLNWFSEYNIIPKGMALKLVLLSSNAVEKIQKDAYKIFETNIKKNSIKLSEEQKKSLKKMNVSNQKFRVHVLQGTTGSGKTMVYFEALKAIINKGFQGLILLPEIGLTGQFEKKFIEFFGFTPAVWHSGITKKKKEIIWSGIASGEIKVVIGARSSLFLPFKKLGLIIVDEEHDQSYKQHEGFRYSARDLAVIRARRENISIILGSATPSIESLNNCAADRYQHLVLTNRAGKAVQPTWSIVDLKNEQCEAGIAASTLANIRQTVEQGQQVLVFLNRRGFAPAIICHQCGWSGECHHCDSRLTVHRARGRLVCHHCDYQKRIPHLCPSCQGQELISVGEGTERSEAHLEKCFPNTKILRVDRDSTRKKGAMQAVFDAADSGEPCILIGTQMLAKGHHFANVTLVAVLDADSGLFSPDFRSHERMGQLLTQVAGRSGRGDLPGKVVIQTHQPQHPLLEVLINKGYGFFAQQLMSERRITQLPPFRHMALIRAESDRANEAESFLRLARSIAERISPPSPLVTYLGPLPAMLEKRAGRFRFVLQINASKRSLLQSLLSALALTLEEHKDSRRVRWTIDVDPQEI